MANRSQRRTDAYEREAAIVQLRNQGVHWKEIAARHRISLPRAYQLWKRGIQRIGEPDIVLERKRALEVRDLSESQLWEEIQNPPPSRIIKHPDGSVETIFDLEYRLHARAEIRKWEEHSARLLGLYSAELKMGDIQQPRAYDDIVTALQTLMESAPAAIEPSVETQATNVTDDETSRIEDIEQALLNGDPRTE